MTGETLRAWMKAARMSAQDIAEALKAGGSDITRQRVYQWCKGEPISEYWASRLEQVMANVDRMDYDRIGARMGRGTTDTRTEAVA